MYMYIRLIYIYIYIYIYLYIYIYIYIYINMCLCVCACGICNKFLVFDLRVVVLACVTKISLRYRGHILAYICQKQNLELNPFPDGQPVKIF